MVRLCGNTTVNSASYYTVALQQDSVLVERGGGVGEGVVRLLDVYSTGTESTDMIYIQKLLISQFRVGLILFTPCRHNYDDNMID